MKYPSSLAKIKQNEHLSKNLPANILLFCAGFLFSRASVLNINSPFGIALIFASPKKFIFSAFLGAFSGYFIPSSFAGGFSYMALAVGALAIKILLPKQKPFCSPWFYMTVAGVSCAATLTAVNINDLSQIWLVLSESLLCAGGTYFIAKTFETDMDVTSGLTPFEIISVCFTFGIAVLSIDKIELKSVNLGAIITLVLILAAAKFGGIATSSVVGCVLAVISFLCGGQAPYYTSFFAFGGLFAGLLSHFGKFGEIGGIAAVAFITLTLGYDTSIIAPVIIECIIAFGIFLLIPKTAENYFARIFLGKVKTPSYYGIKNALSLRLQFTSQALKSISATVEEISDELSKINTPDFDKLLFDIENTACKECSMCVHCWETEKNKTVEQILKIAHDQNKKTFNDNCPHEYDFIDITRQKYGVYISKINAEKRIGDIRSMVSLQFDGISDMLYDLSNEFKYFNRHDKALTEKIVTTLKNMGLMVTECCAARDKYGRISAEIKVKGGKELAVNKRDIMKKFAIVFGTEIEQPCVIKGETETLISVCEKPVYCANIGVSQYCAEDNTLCGDNCEYFFDGRGHLVLMLSDGMGHGPRAAVDSSMINALMSKLIKSGFGYDCSLKIVNSSMMFKSTDESLATLDIVSIDLFNGETTFLKAGAAPTFVRRSGKISKAVSASLPAGILREIGFDKATVAITSGDIV
ncbi:MAG: SpoIIE family protein phosphatase [Oscillospiraceae bacterium]|nr:SpoIIE family protein phosphatase [Candidatus Equicaccousia limihippi]